MTLERDMRGFDFHCHLDLLPNPPDVVARCAHEGIAVLTVTTTPKAWPQNRKWAERTESIFAAAGLHPELVAERYDEADLLEQQITESSFIGEVGLDGSQQHKSSYGKQKEVFARVLGVAQGLGGRVITIHSRNAVRDVISAIERLTTPQNVLCILHWFAGTTEEAQRATAAGCFFSVNAATLIRNHGRRLVQSIPEDRILTETDSPFAKAGGSKCMPWDVVDTAARLAETRGISLERMNSVLCSNARQILDFCAKREKGASIAPCRRQS